MKSSKSQKYQECVWRSRTLFATNHFDHCLIDKIAWSNCTCNTHRRMPLQHQMKKSSWTTTSTMPKSSTKKAKTLLPKATQLYISERGMHTNTKKFNVCEWRTSSSNTRKRKLPKNQIFSSFWELKLLAGRSNCLCCSICQLKDEKWENSCLLREKSNHIYAFQEKHSLPQFRWVTNWHQFCKAQQTQIRYSSCSIWASVVHPWILRMRTFCWLMGACQLLVQGGGGMSLIQETEIDERSSKCNNSNWWISMVVPVINSRIFFCLVCFFLYLVSFLFDSSISFIHRSVPCIIPWMLWLQQHNNKKPWMHAQRGRV